MEPQKQRFEHDFLLDELKIIIPSINKEYDITDQLVQLSYTEDILQGLIFGELFVDDSSDIVGLIPLIGGEKIKFSLTSPGEDTLKFEGPIYEIKNQMIQGGTKKNQTYSMYFITQFAIDSAKTRITKSWNGKKYSDMITDIIETHSTVEKDLFVEETLYEQNFLANNEKVLKVINKIAARSISNNANKSCLHFFYESRDGFNFVSLDTLIEKKPIEKINYSVRNISSDRTKFFKTVNVYETDTIYDIPRDIDSGYISSKLFKIDPIRRKFSQQIFNLYDEWENFSHTDKHKPFLQKQEDNISFLQNPTSISLIISDENQDFIDHLTSKDPEIKPDRFEELLLKRQSRFQQIIHQFIRVNIPGNVKYKVGEIIEFDLPEVTGRVSNEYPEEIDKFKSGKYLIASVAHIVTKHTYNVNMELVKDSFVNEVFFRDPIKEYRK